MVYCCFGFISFGFSVPCVLSYSSFLTWSPRHLSAQVAEVAKSCSPAPILLGTAQPLVSFPSSLFFNKANLSQSSTFPMVPNLQSVASQPRTDPLSAGSRDQRRGVPPLRTALGVDDCAWRRGCSQQNTVPSNRGIFRCFQESISLGKILTNLAICLRGHRSRKPLQKNLSKNCRLPERGLESKCMSIKGY